MLPDSLESGFLAVWEQDTHTGMFITRKISPREACGQTGIILEYAEKKQEVKYAYTR